MKAVPHFSITFKTKCKPNDQNSKKASSTHRGYQGGKAINFQQLTSSCRVGKWQSWLAERSPDTKREMAVSTTPTTIKRASVLHNLLSTVTKNKTVTKKLHVTPQNAGTCCLLLQNPRHCCPVFDIV